MTWWVILIVLVIAGIAYIAVSISKGVPEPIFGIEGAIISLLRQGYDEGRLSLRIPSSSETILFVKHIRAPGDYGVRLMLSEGRVQAEHYDEAVRFLSSCGLKCGEHRDEIDANHAHRGVEVDFGMDTAEAGRSVIKLLERVWELSPADCILVRLDNAALAGNIIDGTESDADDSESDADPTRILKI